MDMRYIQCVCAFLFSLFVPACAAHQTKVVTDYSRREQIHRKSGSRSRKFTTMHAINKEDQRKLLTHIYFCNNSIYFYFVNSKTIHFGVLLIGFCWEQFLFCFFLTNFKWIYLFLGIFIDFF